MNNNLDHPEYINEAMYEKKPLRDRAYPYVVGVSLVIATVLLIVMLYIEEVS